MPFGILSSTEILTLIYTLIVVQAEFHPLNTLTPPPIFLRKRSEVVASFNHLMKP
jgi:hypothetical protein